MILAVQSIGSDAIKFEGVMMYVLDVFEVLFCDCLCAVC
jgi:hypothetical protein